MKLSFGCEFGNYFCYLMSIIGNAGNSLGIIRHLVRMSVGYVTLEKRLTQVLAAKPLLTSQQR